MVAVKKDAVTGTFTPRHSSAGVLRNSGQPATLADGVSTKFGAMLLADRPASRSGLATKGAITLDERPSSRPGLATKGAISLDQRPSSQSGLATKGAISLDHRPSSRSGLAPPTTPIHTTPTDTAPTPAPAAKRRDRKGRISLDDLFKKANRLSQLHKPHKANDAGWEAIERVRARDGELGLNHFKLLKSLGCGDIGSVYLSELRDTKFRFAMKVMDLGSFSSRRKQLRAETERDILSILDHPFLPTLYAHFETPQFLCLVMEFCSGGDLHSLRQRQTGRFFTDKSARFYAAEVLLALEYLHMMGVVYRDLKPENVLVRGDGHIMLSDFDLSLKVSVSPTLLTHSSSVSSATSSSCNSTRGRDEASDAAAFSNATSCLPRTISRRASLTRPAVDVSDLKFAAKPPSSKWKPRLSKSSSKSTRNPTNEQVVPLPELVAEPTGVRSMSFVGTHEYLAPEIIAGDGHGSAVDWWTFGIFLFELLYGKTPFKGADNDVTLVNVLAQPLEFPEKGDPYHQEVGSSAKDLIKALLVKDPQKRLGFNRGATEVKQHPFFEGINWALIRCTLPPQIPRSHSLQSQLRTQKQQDDGLLPPSKLTILPVSAVDQQLKFYDMNEDAKEPSGHFEYF